jgi:hypothetical protein
MSLCKASTNTDTNAGTQLAVPTFPPKNRAHIFQTVQSSFTVSFGRCVAGSRRPQPGEGRRTNVDLRRKSGFKIMAGRQRLKQSEELRNRR